ncbi:ABC transporter substrate-binding protein [Salinicola rhizosphaerae]|uniref:ABC transporter substrate-binding protein n=1 Tax=Salinicola rhizosphaerae TaxID=1443141 RepID=A0ABQ3E5E2_9GAMM|nr:ABC transporter substrate-binding protein [Salinicola rhizosphaerae]GHB23831.1 ABC transporter substrate-binding protein [Salinicola rhizosphaerae]
MQRKLWVSALIAMTATATVQAQERPTLYLGAYGGSYESIFRDSIIPAFEKAHDVNIAYVAGNSTDTLAKLQAQRNDQQMDVAIMDDGPTYQAINYGLCQSQTQDPNLDDLYDFARFPDDKATGVGIIAGGLAYNKAVFQEEGWDAPDSWDDLRDERFAGAINVPSISNSYGLYALVMMARMNGGGEKNIEPGFEAFERDIAPNVLSFTPSPGKTSELYQNHEIVMSVWGSGRVQSLADTGFPIEFVYPKEGAVALVQGACLVKGTQHADLAQAFIDYLLTPDVQELLARKRGNGPTNRHVELPADLADKVPYGDRVSNLVTLDWDTVNQNRQEWTNLWNRRIER